MAREGWRTCPCGDKFSVWICDKCGITADRCLECHEELKHFNCYAMIARPGPRLFSPIVVKPILQEDGRSDLLEEKW